MIPRYTLPEMADLFADQSRYATWVKVEILASEAQAGLGRVPAAAVEDMRRARVPLAARVAEIEKERDHEVLSFLAAYCEDIPEDSARWVHLGMTSYDLVDTALGHTLARATDLLLAAARRLRATLVGKALEHWDTVMVGRTHGVHAEPTTFGHKLGVHAFAVDRSITRLTAAREAVAVGTVSGSVGTYALIDPEVERHVCDALGLGVEPVPSQVVARDRHAQLMQAVAALGACIEQIALELRLLQRTEVREVEEHRTGAYQGSSAMPHKRNPTTSERLCGLARLLRGYADTALENVALWHERDLAHQSVERVILPDSLSVGHFQTVMAADLVDSLTVRPERMRAHIDTTDGLIHSSAVLADLLARGVERERAYRGVQAAADHTLATGEHFAAGLAREGIDVESLEPERFLTRHDVIRTRLETLRELDD
ncbi:MULTISPECIES: adenylosuccinate lyase [Streptomyces]|uniref:Adenylosuccinate lyase n=3 Tax=Streptomyces rochei group TaxID=2867164 RepID=A0ABW7DVL2_STRRO|nr:MULTISPECIES: adenylosuccinate lyase [Streptomyces]GGZ07820.1 adenylosuccinate lyase [Streptomyces geysiriensis]MBQ0914802.1 adenylosuccinate lyase [Streptomyces sp. RM99]MCC8449269.1 adenylosuccinate lyase [Streptomyces rochei]RSS08081.1 adenylosuccinate lyase [Streptomyces sp. WAC08401]RSS23500.1 adenylosuccinate lyase [Streptomyces sp. WAC08452]